MNSKELVSRLIMLGWQPVGGGIILAPESYAPGNSIMIASENCILIGNSNIYTNNKDTLEHILEYTDD